MKSIARTVLAISLATAGGVTFAATPYPSSAQETTSLSQVFPNIQTHADLHRSDVPSHASVTYPSSVADVMALSDVFPELQTYAELRRDVVLSNAPAWPSSANETTSLAELDGFSRGDSGSTYAGMPEPSTN